MDVKYPEIEVQLSGEDGNAMLILARVRKALRRNGVEKDEIEEFVKEATSGDYNHLIATCMRWVNAG